MRKLLFNSCCFFALALLASSAQADLISYWTYDDDSRSGTTLNDTVGTNHGTMYNNPAVITGVSGQALSFNQSGSNQYTAIPHSASLNIGAPGDSMTVGTWVNTDWQNGGWFRTIIAKYGTSGITESWGLGWTGTDDLGFYVRDNTNTRSTATSPGSFLGINGDWHHIAGVRDATAGTIRYYLDGQSVATVTDNTGNYTNSRDILFARNNNDYAQ